MIVNCTVLGEERSFDTERGLDLSIELHKGYPQVNCFNAPLFSTTPLREGSFVGSTLHGSPVNFYDVAINPHGNGTHTECVGHIAKEPYYINECYKSDFHVAQLISIFPLLEENGDKTIPLGHLEQLWDYKGEDALVIRTLPNGEEKRTKNYSNSNPTYFTDDAMRFIVETGIKHLLIDLPSVDRELDEGRVSCHKIFWNYPGNEVRKDATISELIFVPDGVSDGIYLLNLQLLNIQLDVSPSRPMLYNLF